MNYAADPQTSQCPPCPPPSEIGPSSPFSNVSLSLPTILAAFADGSLLVSGDEPPSSHNSHTTHPLHTTRPRHHAYQSRLSCSPRVPRHNCPLRRILPSPLHWPRPSGHLPQRLRLVRHHVRQRQDLPLHRRLLPRIERDDDEGLHQLLLHPFLPLHRRRGRRRGVQQHPVRRVLAAGVRNILCVQRHLPHPGRLRGRVEHLGARVGRPDERGGRGSWTSRCCSDVDATEVLRDIGGRRPTFNACFYAVS